MSEDSNQYQYRYSIFLLILPIRVVYWWILPILYQYKCKKYVHERWDIWVNRYYSLVNLPIILPPSLTRRAEEGCEQVHTVGHSLETTQLEWRMRQCVIMFNLEKQNKVLANVSGPGINFSIIVFVLKVLVQAFYFANMTPKTE